MRIFSERKLVKLTDRIMSKIGDYSFEIYLIHIPLIEVLQECIDRFSLQNIKVIVWLFGGILLVVGCRLLRQTTKICIAVLKKRMI